MEMESTADIITTESIAERVRQIEAQNYAQEMLQTELNRALERALKKEWWFAQHWVGEALRGIRNTKSEDLFLLCKDFEALAVEEGRPLVRYGYRVYAYGNGAGAPSFELSEIARKRGLTVCECDHGGGPNFEYGRYVNTSTLEEAKVLARKCQWFVGGEGGAIFGGRKASVWVVPLYRYAE